MDTYLLLPTSYFISDTLHFHLLSELERLVEFRRLIALRHRGRHPRVQALGEALVALLHLRRPLVDVAQQRAHLFCRRRRRARLFRRRRREQPSRVRRRASEALHPQGGPRGDEQRRAAQQQRLLLLDCIVRRDALGARRTRERARPLALQQAALCGVEKQLTLQGGLRGSKQRCKAGVRPCQQAADLFERLMERRVQQQTR